jgi:hypothetical protein
MIILALWLSLCVIVLTASAELSVVVYHPAQTAFAGATSAASQGGVT